MAVIKVLQIFTTLNIGGAESMIMNYYRQLDKSKIQFDFLVHRPDKGAFEDEIKELGGQIFRLNPISPFFPNKYYEELRSFLKNNPYQIIHSHLNTFSYFTLKIAEEFKIPTRIAHAHIAIDKVGLKDIITQKENIKESLKKIVKFQLRKKSKVHATHLFSCGDKAGKWLFGENAEFTLMNNSINAKNFTYNPEIENSVRKELGLENKFIIGHVGRFGSQKNHAFLLKIFKSIVEKKNNCALVLIGGGPLQEVIKNEAKSLGILDKVQFLGVRKDIPKLMQMFNAFIFPSFYEGLPVTLIEAQAAGIQIFASDTITNEVEITNNIQFLSIEESAEYWANEVIKEEFSKTNTLDQIIDAGYDIKSNTLELEEFYLSL